MRRLALLCLLSPLGITVAGCGSTTHMSAATEKLDAIYIAIEAKWPVQHTLHIYHPVCKAATGERNHNLYSCTLYPGMTLGGFHGRIQSYWRVDPVRSVTDTYGTIHGEHGVQAGPTYGEEWKSVTGLNYVARYDVNSSSLIPIARVAAVAPKRN